MLVELGVLVGVFQIDEGLDHVLEVEAGQLQRLADLAEAILDLLFQARVGAIVPLPRDVERLADHHAGREQAARAACRPG